jgi:hypothetical protein
MLTDVGKSRFQSKYRAIQIAATSARSDMSVFPVLYAKTKGAPEIAANGGAIRSNLDVNESRERIRSEAKRSAANRPIKTMKVERRPK